VGTRRKIHSIQIIKSVVQVSHINIKNMNINIIKKIKKMIIII